MNQILILVHKCGLRFFVRASEHYAKNDLKSYYSTLKICGISGKIRQISGKFLGRIGRFLGKIGKFLENLRDKSANLCGKSANFRETSQGPRKFISRERPSGIRELISRERRTGMRDKSLGDTTLKAPKVQSTSRT